MFLSDKLSSNPGFLSSNYSEFLNDMQQWIVFQARNTSFVTSRGIVLETFLSEPKI